MSDFTACLSLNMQGMTGGEHKQPQPETVALEVRSGQVLGPADFGLSGQDLDAFDGVCGCRIRLMTLFDDWAIFEYRHLVIQTRKGCIDLPTAGGFVLRPGQNIALATPTLEGGIRLSVALKSIQVPAGAARK